MPPIKAYTFSVMAINKYAPLDGESSGAIYYGHRSGITVADCLETVALQAKEQIFEMFPLSDGWSNHDLVVTPIPERFFAGLQTYINQGLFTGEANPREEMKQFHFGDDPSRILLDADVSDKEN